MYNDGENMEDNHIIAKYVDSADVKYDWSSQNGEY